MPTISLTDGLSRLGLSADLEPALDRYLDLLLQWNQAYNLTAIRDRAEMAVKHVFDSLVIHAQLPPDAALADIGSGAGLPGLLLALARPDLTLSSIESAGKKARFQREVVRALGLGERVTILPLRAEQAGPTAGFDCLTARAFGTLAQILEVGGHLLRPGGVLLALKGKAPVEEIAELPPGFRYLNTQALVVPGLAAERHLVQVQKLD